jgi:tetratricopeptide (TPR) repeat protein
MIRREFAFILAAALTLGVHSTSAQAQRLLESSAVTGRDDHLDLTVEFSCSLRYQTHSPASESDQLRVTLQIGPDCSLPPAAQFAVERMLPADASGLVRSIELQPGLAGGAELLINWNHIEKYVLAPTAGMRGLRVRVLRRTSSQVLVNDTPQQPGGYAVNLDSSREAFADVAVAKAAALLRTPVYVSATKIDGETWYRLRAGPFDSRREAESKLREARSSYATAWLGIEDEQPAEAQAEGDLAPSPTFRAAARAPEIRADAALDQVLEESRVALARKHYDEAIARLTQVLIAEDYVHRVNAAEMLGLARERKGQLAQAKSAYEDFLRRYPQSTAAERIRQRLQTLRTASLPGRHGSGGGTGTEGWSAFGSASQIYRRDNSQLRTDVLSRNLATQNALLNDVDSVVRHRGERRDFTARANLGYMKDMLKFGPGDQLRVSSAFAELNDRELGMGARLGRQSRGMAGLQGTFDGVLGNWQWRENLGFNFAAGSPVESTRNGLNTDRKFISIGTDIANRDRSWDTAVYALGQQYAGNVDRRSIGVETRYMKPGRTLFALADYDLHFGDINSVMLLGTLITDSRWTFNFDAGRQRSPLLSIRNALIGQPTLAFDELSLQFNDTEIKQLALDRSAQLTQFSLSAGHPLGERGQWTLNLNSTELSGTPASGGIEAIPAPGRDDSVSSEVLLNSLFTAGDVHSVALRYQQGDTATLMSVGLGSRIPVGSALRITSRLRVDHRTLHADNTQEWVYLPSLRLDYVRGRGIVEFEAGAEIGQRDRANFQENSKRYFFSLGYRLSFDRSRR